MNLNTQIPDALYQQLEPLANPENISIDQLITIALSTQIFACVSIKSRVNCYN